jgi:hypothetical protein
MGMDARLQASESGIRFDLLTPRVAGMAQYYSRRS